MRVLISLCFVVVCVRAAAIDGQVRQKRTIGHLKEKFGFGGHDHHEPSYQVYPRVIRVPVPYPVHVHRIPQPFHVPIHYPIHQPVHDIEVPVYQPIHSYKQVFIPYHLPQPQPIHHRFEFAEQQLEQLPVEQSFVQQSFGTVEHSEPCEQLPAHGHELEAGLEYPGHLPQGW